MQEHFTVGVVLRQESSVIANWRMLQLKMIFSVVYVLLMFWLLTKWAWSLTLFYDRLTLSVKQLERVVVHLEASRWYWLEIFSSYHLWMTNSALNGIALTNSLHIESDSIKFIGVYVFFAYRIICKAASNLFYLQMQSNGDITNVCCSWAKSRRGDARYSKLSANPWKTTYSGSLPNNPFICNKLRGWSPQFENSKLSPWRSNDLHCCWQECQ